jgi:hypothetical protein
MVVMTNADRGVDLMGEIMRAISEQYGWGISNPRKVEVVNQLPDSLQRFTGSYRLDFLVPEIGDYNIEVTMTNGVLQIIDPNNGEHNVLTPLGSQNFIDLENGDEVEFAYQEGKWEILFNGRYRFLKTED